MNDVDLSIFGFFYGREFKEILERNDYKVNFFKKSYSKII